MLTAYVAVASRRGLETFLPEDVGVAASARVADGSLSYWAVLEDDDARRIGRTLAAGEPAAALRLLDRCAAYAGPILPRAE